MRIQFKESKLEDSVSIANNMRDQDKEEYYALTGSKDYLSAVAGSFNKSEICYTAFNEEEPVCIYGLSSTINPNVGVPWMLGTDKLFTFRRELREYFPKYIQEFHNRYVFLYNYVDVRNSISIRWLKSVKFVFLQELELGPFNMPFYEFARLCERSD